MKTCQGNREDSDKILVAEVKVARGSSDFFIMYMLANCGVFGAGRVIWLCPQYSLLSNGELQKQREEVNK